MSGTLEPTNNQSLVSFNGIEQVTEEKPVRYTRSVATKEYAAAGFYDKDLNIILYKQSDALLSKFGDSIIEKMLRDPEVKKCETVTKIGVLSEGITFFPALSKPAPLKPLEEGEEETIEQKRERLTREKEIKRFELAEKYARFATRAIDNLDTSFIRILENMLDAITYGNKVAEQTYIEKYDKEFGKELLTLTSIRVKNRRTTKFVINKFKKLIGFEVDVKNPDGTLGTTILPRDKFVVLTFRGKDGDPRGTSILEAVYNAWYLKMQLWPEYLRWLLQCAIPSLVGYLPPTEEGSKTYIKDENGELVRDNDGNPVYANDIPNLLHTLIQLRNASAIALPHGAKVEPISNTVSGDPFKGMRDVLNEEIEMGMILQTLATSEGRFMSRAASQSHLSILDLFVVFIKEMVIEMVRNDILKPLFKINFADFDMELLPNVSMGDIERRDWATDAVAIATLWKSGFMGESQKVGYDKLLSAPDRDVESDKNNQKDMASFEASLKSPQAGATEEEEITTKDKAVLAEQLKNQIKAYEMLFGEKLI